MTTVQPLRTLGVVLFDDFELLDVCGPVQMFGRLPDRLRIVTAAPAAGPVRSYQGIRVEADVRLADCPPLDLLLVPGGLGTRNLVSDAPFLAWLKERGEAAEMVLSVCTGSALLARAGLLDGRRATSNKQSFRWVRSQGPAVRWVGRARWVDDGDRVTSSGVSAGTDMALAVIARLYGTDQAEALAAMAEHSWSPDPDRDPFAVEEEGAGDPWD